MHSVRHWTSFFVGVIIFLLGLLPLIGKGAWLGPLITTWWGTVAAYIVAFGGLYIIVDSFFEFTFHSGIGVTTLLIGLLVFAMGLVTILHSMGVLAFKIPFMTPESKIVYYILFMLEGLFLMLACFMMD